VGEFIHEAGVYAAGPDQLTGQFLPVTAGDEEAWYFFTTLKLKGDQKSTASIAPWTPGREDGTSWGDRIPCAPTSANARSRG